MNKIYLDYNATTPVRSEVLEALLPYYTSHFGNPSSVHWAGRAVAGVLEEAREKVAVLFGASPADVIFTSCGSEGNNFALKGVAQSHQGKGRHLITTSVEHPSVLEVCRMLKKSGWQVSYLSVDGQGRLDLDELEETITPQTALISVMCGNNETGALFPLAEIGEIAQRHNICFHSDLVQGAGKLALDVKQLGLDLAVISGHKFGAPKGVGAVYVKANTALAPLIHGGHQERNRRAGTQNVAGIVGLGAACELSCRELTTGGQRVRRLRDRLEDGLFEQISHLRLNGPVERENRLPNTLNLSFEGVEAESLLINLDLKGIAASSGSACSSGSLEPSHVITAMGIDPLMARSSLRFSLGPGNTAEEIDYVLTELPVIVQRLRKINQ